VVCDAGPLIHLDQLASLELLADFGHVLVPGAVWEEAKRHRPALFSRPHSWLDRVSISSPPEPILRALIQVFSLDAGEQEALCLMRGCGAGLFLTDDAAARLVATQLGHEVHGTIGVLVRAIRRGLRTAEEILALLSDIPTRTTLHIRADLLNEIQTEVRSASGHKG
jgi:predicted nucleic acid-binding protein